MIGRAAQERDDLLAAVAEPHAECARVEIDLLAEIAAEEQHVAEPSGRGSLAAVRTAATHLARRVARAVERERRIGRRQDALLVPDVDEVAVGITEPESPV